MAIRNILPVVLAAYAAASLFHHVHNAEFLHEYPNMPAWISRSVAYGAWLAATAIGITGYVLLRRGYRFVGLALLILYGCYGLDSLAHYALAPVSAHTPSMNFSIWLEAAMAAGLLITVVKQLLVERMQPQRQPPSP